MAGPYQSTRRQRLVMLVMALAVLLPSLYGFGSKFIEFIALYQGDVEGVFAISPISNYLLASLGFLCLFGWAALHGMFRDIEQPKRTMLANERALDRAAPWVDCVGPDFKRRAGLGPAAPAERHRFKEFYGYDRDE